MNEDYINKITVGQVVQFTEGHKWCGSLGFIEHVEKCGESNYRFMIGCTFPDNHTKCNTAYIFSMAKDCEFEPLLDGHTVLMPKMPTERSKYRRVHEEEIWT